MRNRFLKLCAVLVLTTVVTKAQQTFYDISTIQKIEINFSDLAWDYKMDTAKLGADSYLMADWVKINGVQYDSVGVKYKGNVSYDSTYIKNPLHIALDEFISQSYQGFKDIKLSNGYADPSMIREALSYSILQNYMDCPRSNFAQVYINGEYAGLYTNDENVGKTFCSEHFYSSQNTFIKCNPIVSPGPSTKSNLKYLSADSSSYFNFYEMKSSIGWNELVMLCDTVTNHTASVSSVVDVDRFNWMLAFNNALVNLDSYSGAFTQNYYLYKDNTNRFNPIVWDLNMSFGGFPYAGSGNISLGTLTVTNMQQLPPALHATDPYWPMINNVMNNAMYRRMYFAHLRTVINEKFVSGDYASAAAQLQAVIDTAVQSDQNKFFTDSQFQNGMSQDVTFGSNVVPGISNLMTARIAYLQSVTEFGYTGPSISSVIPSNPQPVINSSLTITANVTNTNSNAVYLGYRFHASDAFVRVSMYDDGAHGDGAAGDNVYGTSIVVASGQTQYYIYAENANAGMFSPERAEHEFYELATSIQTAMQGEVAINEFMADNESFYPNENGQFEDWIELVNTTSSPKNLFGLYLSDDPSNPTKFAIPENTILPAHGYLIFWADENNSTASYIHCNFKLSATGESIQLSNGSGSVFDSVYFNQQTPDVSMSRCPNGTGSFSFSLPTFNSSNCSVGIDEINRGQAALVFPAPADQYLYVRRQGNEPVVCKLFNLMGEKIAEISTPEALLTFNVSGFPSGIYVLMVNDTEVHKVQITR